ncbi:hypothetical protein L4D77_22605 [Photobacterium frigidiphilum]|uniref:hypothetical protein n=1 Tax=Photobacterium frigidiphilum TaxID=264736 RepID=UPI003D14E163
MKLFSCKFITLECHPDHVVLGTEQQITVFVKCKYQKDVRELAEKELSFWDREHHQDYKTSKIGTATTTQYQHYRLEREQAGYESDTALSEMDDPVLFSYIGLIQDTLYRLDNDFADTCPIEIRQEMAEKLECAFNEHIENTPDFNIDATKREFLEVEWDDYEAVRQTLLNLRCLRVLLREVAHINIKGSQPALSEPVKHKHTDNLDYGHFADVKKKPDQYTTDAAANKIHSLMGGNVEIDDIRMIVSFIKDHQVPYLIFTQ